MASNLSNANDLEVIQDSRFSDSVSSTTAKPDFWSTLGKIGQGVLNFIGSNANPLSFIGNAVGNLFNYGHQLANYNYQKDLQNKIFEREDSAFSRLVSDYQNSGVSPSFALGSSGSGSGSVVNTTAPQVKNDMLERVGVLNSLKMQDEQIKGLKKDNEYKQTLIDKNEQELRFNSSLFDSRYLNANLRNVLTSSLIENSEFNEELKQLLVKAREKDLTHYDEERLLYHIEKLLPSFASFYRSGKSAVIK